MKLRNIAASTRHLPAGRAAVAAGNVLACSGLVGFIACADGGITNPVAAPARAAAVASAPGAQPHAAVVTATTGPSSGDTTVQTFTYTPATGTTVNFRGGAKVVLPAASICDPRSSGYGATTWNKSCSVATSPITFTVHSWASSTGNPQATVSPDVRFAPGKIAELYLPAPTNDPTAKPVIQWCSATMTNCVDEGLTDPTLTTQYDSKPQIAHRRIKHFSGYNIGWGRGSGGSGSAASSNAQQNGQ